MNVEEIGEGSSALLCLTNNTQCCSLIFHTNRPEWYFPNGSQVGIKGNGYNSFYRNRGHSVARLNRRYDTTMPNGVFHCTIPDINGTNQNIYVGIYTPENGELL